MGQHVGAEHHPVPAELQLLLAEHLGGLFPLHEGVPGSHGELADQDAEPACLKEAVEYHREVLLEPGNFPLKPFRDVRVAGVVPQPIEDLPQHDSPAFLRLELLPKPVLKVWGKPLAQQGPFLLLPDKILVPATDQDLSTGAPREHGQPPALRERSSLESQPEPTEVVWVPRRRWVDTPESHRFAQHSVFHTPAVVNDGNPRRRTVLVDDDPY